MKAHFFLHVKENGSIRTTKQKTTTNPDEVSIAMEIELPDKLFQKPIISGKITVDESMVSPNTIEANVEEQIKEAISGVKGVTLTLTIPETEG